MALAAAIASSSLAKPRTGATGPKISSSSRRALARDVAEHGRLVEVAATVDALAAHEHARALADGVVDQLGDLRSAGRRRSAGRPSRRARCRGRSSARPCAGPGARRSRPRPPRGRGSGWPIVHASPMLRIFASSAPSTASSRSASSKIRNGALPPSSIDTRSTCSADCSMSLRPTSVDPVKDSLRVRGSRMSGSMTDPDERAVMTLRTPPGRPASSRICGHGQHRQRRLLGGLDHHRAAGGDRRADLARAHGQREVPRRDEDARADGLLHRQHAALAVLVDLEAAVDAHGLLRVPAEERPRRRRSRPATRPAACPSRAS